VKKLFSLVACLLLLFVPLMARAGGLEELFGFLFGEGLEETQYGGMSTMSPQEAVKALREAGLNVDESFADTMPDRPCTVMDVLVALGMHEPDGAEPAPATRMVYALEAECFDIDHMYTDFLTGIGSIVPEVEITEIREDLSGMTEDMDFSQMPPTDGKRSFSFLCNGTPYTCELDSRGDWFNEAAIDFMEQVLRKENCSKQLCVVGTYELQGYLIFYADEETISNVMELLANTGEEAFF